MDEAVLYRGFTCLPSELPAILAEPLPPGTHWGSYRMAEYFAHQALGDRPGDEPVILAVPLSEFDPQFLRPDLEMTRDPVFEEDVEEEGLDEQWALSDKGWQDCLECYEAVVYDAPLELRPEHVMSGPAASDELAP